jgi:biofilm PGA synthesis lipoprotein PgaB
MRPGTEKFMMESQHMYGATFSALEKTFKILAHCIIIIFFALPCTASQTFLTLCYHDIPAKASVPEDVPRHIFVNHMEYLKKNGYSVISPDDIISARKGIKPLPERAVLLSFDDAYVSFYEFVYPILKLYNYPAVLSVVSSWIENKPDYVGKKKLMSWEQIREVANSELVKIASHSHDSHKGIFYNPFGNVEPAMSTFIYFPEEKRYETDEEFRKRIKNDLKQSITQIENKTAFRPRILTWPYGEFNKTGMEEAQKLGFELIFTLQPQMSQISMLPNINRNIITKVMEYDDFASKIDEKFVFKNKMRAIQIDLDMIVNPKSLEESDHNLGLLIERLIAYGVNTVIIQAFCDRDATGNIRSLYFSNSTMPVEMDFLSHAVNRIRIRGMQVYVWMPVLSFELPDKDLNESLKVKELKDSEIKTTSSWYRRLTPFDKRCREIIKSLYRDLSAHVRFDGILFQDDAYLTDHEDFHPAALRAFKDRYGSIADPKQLKNDRIRDQWTQLKTEKLNSFIQELIKTVQEYRPLAKTARNIYSIVLLNPYAQEWFSQNFESYLENYDYTVIMAYPQMEGLKDLKDIKRWLKGLINIVDKNNAHKKVIFKLQSFDWGKNRWVSQDLFKKELRFLVASGVWHLAYYPDNVFEDQPKLDMISSIISTHNFPRSWRQK